MSSMNVEEFKVKTQKKLFWVLVLIKHLWTTITFASKVVNLKKLLTFCKWILMRKNWDDVNWLSTLKKDSQLESCEVFKI
jgi:hypothetical protein